MRWRRLRPQSGRNGDALAYSWMNTVMEKRAFRSKKKVIAAKLSHGRGREGFAHDRREFGAEDLDGAHHFRMGQRRDAHLKREARNSAERFVHVEHFFGDGFCIADEERAGRAAGGVEL